MKYIVTSALGCAIGPGQRVRLTPQQIATRAASVTVLNEKTGEVEPTTQIVFKRGEEINLAEKPADLASYFQTVLEPAAKSRPVDETPGAKSLPAAAVPAGGPVVDADPDAPNPAA